jgi:hypothetical protein
MQGRGRHRESSRDLPVKANNFNDLMVPVGALSACRPQLPPEFTRIPALKSAPGAGQSC